MVRTYIILSLGLLGADPEVAISPTAVHATAVPSRETTQHPLPLKSPAEASAPQPRNIFLRYLDRDHDNHLAERELPQRFQRAFERTDSNGDGLLDETEILYAQTRIGMQARKLENLRLDRSGELAVRGRGNEILVTTGVRMLHRLDRDGDGFVDHAELGKAARQPGQVAGEAIASAREATASAEPVADVPLSSDSLSEQSQESGEKHAPAVGKSPLPTAPEILENLDANKDGIIDPSEAVDQLADNFGRLDKDRSGGLDLFEIDRGLRLARLFGIKPKSDPRIYQKRPAPPETSSKSATSPDQPL